jgi:hypothetical protein
MKVTELKNKNCEMKNFVREALKILLLRPWMISLVLHSAAKEIVQH